MSEPTLQSGFSIAAIIRPQYLVPAESIPTEASLQLAMYAAAHTFFLTSGKESLCSSRNLVRPA